MFERQRGYVNDLVLPFHRIIRGKTFVDCEIVGPANVALVVTKTGRGSVLDCSFIDSGGIVVTQNAAVPFGVKFEDCTFLRCRIYGLILFATADQLRHEMPGTPEAFWLTGPLDVVTNPPVSSLPSPTPPR